MEDVAHVRDVVLLEVRVHGNGEMSGEEVSGYRARQPVRHTPLAGARHMSRSCNPPPVPEFYGDRVAINPHPHGQHV